MNTGIHLIQEVWRPRCVVEGSELAHMEDDHIERIVVYHVEIAAGWETELRACGLYEAVLKPSTFKGNDKVTKAKSLIAPLTIGFSVLKERTKDTIINTFILSYLEACKQFPTANVRLRV